MITNDDRGRLLRGPEAMIERLDPLRHTIAEKEMASTYLPGHVMIFERDPRAADIRAGIADRVIAVLDSTHQELTNEKTFYVEISRARDRRYLHLNFVTLSQDEWMRDRLRHQFGKPSIFNFREAQAAPRLYWPDPAWQPQQAHLSRVLLSAARFRCLPLLQL